MPPIGKSDHDIVYAEYGIKAKRIQQAPREIYLYKRADMYNLRNHLARFRDSFLSSKHSRLINCQLMTYGSVLSLRHRGYRKFYSIKNDQNKI